MANWAYTNYVIEGPREILEKIYNAILTVETNLEGGKYEALVLEALGLNWKKYDKPNSLFDLRGNIFPETVEFNNVLSFNAEEAWGVSDLKTVLKGEFPALIIYYNTEEPYEAIYATNDAEGKYFPYRFLVDTCIDGNYQNNYFKCKETLYKWLYNITDSRINSEEEVKEFNENCAEDDYIYIYEIAVIKDEMD